MTRYLGDGWLLPELDDSTRAFFTSGRLMFQVCARCGQAQHPPADVCPGCRSFEFIWRESRGLGRVESSIVVHHPVHPLLAGRGPYVVVLVSVDDVPGVRVIGNVVNREPSAVAIGQRVRVVFEDAVAPETGEPLRIPQWEVV